MGERNMLEGSQYCIYMYIRVGVCACLRVARERESRMQDQCEG